jgi:hypothetical protein
MRRFLLLLTALSSSAWAQPPAPQPAQTPIVVHVQMPPTPHRDFLGYLQSLGPLIAACVAVGVGLMQRHLQKRQLTQDLFEKRWKIYSGVQDYLAALLREDSGDDLYAPYRQFRLDTDPGQFLFGKAVWEHIEAIGQTGVRFRTVRKKVKDHGLIAHAPVTPITPDDQHWHNEAVSKLIAAQQEEDELRHSIVEAFEGGNKDVFTRDLRIERADS